MTMADELTAMERGVLNCVASAQPPLATIAQVGDKCGVSITDARTAIDRLRALRLIELVPGVRRGSDHEPAHFELTALGRTARAAT